MLNELRKPLIIAGLLLATALGTVALAGDNESGGEHDKVECARDSDSIGHAGAEGSGHDEDGAEKEGCEDKDRKARHDGNDRDGNGHENDND